MKKILLSLFTVYSSQALAQELPASIEQQLEDRAVAGTEDDSYLQRVVELKRNKLNLNIATKEELQELNILTDLQIDNLILYRQLLGALISIYELQSVPAWDISTIRQLLPFVTITIVVDAKEEISKRLKMGDHSILLRSSQKTLFRYQYNYKSLLQYGITATTNFYSFHLFARKLGVIQSLALGDFTVNMGQGLIQWQSFAFKKSVNVIGVEKQSTVLRPYRSSGGLGFHRGIGITLRKKSVEATLFASLNKQIAAGAILRYLHTGWHISINALYYQFPSVSQKREEPYNLFAIKTDRWYNTGIDYSYTYRNSHLFGELAMDHYLHKAVVNGLVISVDPTIDISLLHRMIEKEYQSVEGNAFTENSSPTNENGIYIGIAIHPSAIWRLDAYADIYKFPWLKYRIDAPSEGKDFLVQLSYTPIKQVGLYIRFRNEQHWRIQLNYTINQLFAFRTRMELLQKDKNQENGFLIYTDLLYKPTRKRLSAIARLQYYETDGYDARIYAYENDVLYSYTVPAFYGKGYRCYVILNYDISKKISCWVRCAVQKQDRADSELKLQGRIAF